MSIVDVDLSAFDDLMQQLGDDAEEAARPAAQAMAQVLYDEMKRNVAALGRVTGNLDRSIYQAFRDKESGPGFAGYRITWNHVKAPHGQLVENGYIQRYKVYVGADGHWHTAVRPEARGTRKPSRNASQAVKDAYFVPLPAPKQVPARSFVRRSTSKFGEAQAAGEATLLRFINGR